MRHIGIHIKHAFAKTRMTERGELMRFFVKQLNGARAEDGYPKITMGHMGKILEKIPTKDLYYIKRVCGDAQNFSKKFWYILNPEKYDK
ncbi:MAG: hypothetical protein AAB798_02800 [Patescibacteria group bacterium]